MPKQTKALRGTALLLSAAVLLGMAAGCSAGRSGNSGWHLPAPDALTGELTLGEGETAVLENDRLTLSVNSANMAVTLEDKRGNVRWSSNPAGGTGSAFNAQFVLSYYDKNGNYSTMESYKDAVERGQTTVYREGEHLYVEYRLGDFELTADSVPQKLSPARFEAFAKKLSAEDAEALRSYYKFYESENMYGIRPKGLNEFLTVRELWLKAGYTDDDLLADNAEFGITGASVNRPYFTVVLDYALTDDGLTVAVPTARLQFSDSYPLYDIRLLQNFGRTDRSDEGFLFVPDGSGAVIRFDPADTRGEAVSLAVYGEDLTVTSTARRTGQLSTERVTLPVFGMADAGRGFLAVIEDGEANAYIEACRRGANNACNAVYPRFLVINKDNVYLEGASSESSKVPQFQQSLYDGAFQVRYILLNPDEEADVPAMAAACRAYLLEKGVLTDERVEDVPLMVETLGGVTGYKSFLGLSYTGTVAATTYRQNVEILEAFEQRGVTGCDLVLAGWSAGGVYHAYPEKVKLLRELGGQQGLDELLRYAAENGVDVFPDVNLMTVYKTGAGFYAPDDASRTLDLNTAKIQTLSYATGLRRESDGILNVERYILSPNKLLGLTEAFLESFSAYGFQALSLRSSGNELYADYDRTDTVDRIASAQISAESLAKLAGAVPQLMVREGNLYAVPYADHILNMASESSGYRLADEDVPFLQMVFHGRKTMAGTPINLKSDYRRQVLRAIEYGMSLHVQLTGEDSQILKDTDCADNYSSGYREWVDIVAEDQKLVEEMLGPVAGAVMLRHDRPAEGVARTVYDNGVTIYVNYTEQAVTVDGVAVPAMACAAAQGGAA